MTTSARRAAAVCVLPALLWLAMASVVEAQSPPKGRKVKSNDLKGFGETDISEIDLESLIEEQQATVDVATARPVGAEQAPGAVTVFKAEDIRNLGARTLLELLRFVPGFDITFDNLGRARIAVRGIASATTPGGSQDVLILQDGIRINEDLTGGATTINLDIPLDHAQKVEILRGPAAAVHGDQALSAVVSIINQTTEDFMGTEASVGFGSFGTQRYALRSGGILAGVKISGYLRFADASGARRLVPEDIQTAADEGRIAEGLPPISVAPGKARDGVRALDAAYAFATREWIFSFRTKNERADGFIGAAENLSRLTQLNNNQLGVDVKWKRSLERVGTVRAYAGFVRNQIADLLEIYPSGYRLLGDFGSLTFGEPGGQGGVFEQLSLHSRRFDLGGTLDHDLKSGHKLLGGMALRRESTYDLEANANLDLRTLTPVAFVDGASLAPLPGAVLDSRRTTFSVFGEDQWKARSRLTLTAGLRFDHLSDVGGTLSPRLAIVSTLRDGLTAKLLYGRAFRAPSFRELIFDLPGGTGNPDLAMVKADELELSVAFSRKRLRAEAHPFLNLVRDTIALPGLPLPGVQQSFANAEGVRVLGVELLASGGFGTAHTFFGSVTLQNPTDRASGDRVPGLARGLLNLGVSLDIRRKIVLTPTLVARTSRPRAEGDSRQDVPGYALFGVTVRARELWRTLEASLSIGNLFGKDYADPSLRDGVPGDYPRPRRRALVHVAYKF